MICGVVDDGMDSIPFICPSKSLLKMSFHSAVVVIGSLALNNRHRGDQLGDVGC